VSLHESARGGDRLATLTALRDVLAEQIDNTESARDVAALSLRLMDVLRQVDELEKASAPAAPKGSGIDEVNARRAAREAGAARQA